jgi:hypothetical protein
MLIFLQDVIIRITEIRNSQSHVVDAKFVLAISLSIL